MSHHPAKLGGHEQFGSKDIRILPVIKGSCDFMGRSPSRKVNIPRYLVAIGTLVVEI